VKLEKEANMSICGTDPAYDWELYLSEKYGNMWD